MTLAPCAFVRHDVLCFGKIRRPRIQRRAQVIDTNEHSVRRYVMKMAVVVVWRRLRVSSREKSGERIDPTTRTNAVLPSVQKRAVCVRAAGAKMIAAYAVATKATRV